MMTVNYAALCVSGFLMLVPFLWMAATSLKADNEVLSVPLRLFGSRIAFENYPRAWNYFPFARFILNDLFVSAAGTVLALITSSLSAYAFARLRFRGKDKLFFAYLATLMVPQQVVVIPMFLMMKQLGWVNTYWALIIPWAFTAFGTFLLRQFYMTIPYDLDEAAVIDGCSHFGIYWRIILPLVRTGLAALGVFTFIGYWNSLLWPLIITNQQSLYTLPIGLQMYHGQYGTQWNLLMAASTITVLPTMIIYLIAQRHIVQGITLSGIAGR